MLKVEQMKRIAKNHTGFIFVPAVSQKARRVGYTLIELMVGVMILGIVLATAFTGMKQGFFLLENARDNTLVSQLLQGEMENLRTTDWDSIDVLKGTTDFSPNSSMLANQNTIYTCQRIITAPKVGQLEVVLNITWSDSRGIAHTNNFISYFTKDGLNDFYTRTF